MVCRRGAWRRRLVQGVRVTSASTPSPRPRGPRTIRAKPGPALSSRVNGSGWRTGRPTRPGRVSGAACRCGSPARQSPTKQSNPGGRAPHQPKRPVLVLAPGDLDGAHVARRSAWHSGGAVETACPEHDAGRPLPLPKHRPRRDSWARQGLEVAGVGSPEPETLDPLPAQPDPEPGPGRHLT